MMVDEPSSFLSFLGLRVSGKRCSATSSSCICSGVLKAEASSVLKVLRRTSSKTSSGIWHTKDNKVPIKWICQNGSTPIFCSKNVSYDVLRECNLNVTSVRMSFMVFVGRSFRCCLCWLRLWRSCTHPSTTCGSCRQWHHYVTLNLTEGMSCRKGLQSRVLMQ